MRRAMLLMALLATAPVSLAGDQERPRKPNIVLLVVESLRQDHVGCYGYKRDTTPALDGLAREGARFDQAIAPSSWTMPSLAGLFTSTPAAVHGVRTATNCISAQLTTLTEELRYNGYQTAGIMSNPMLRREFGFGAGFDYYDDYTIPLSIDADPLGDGKRSVTANDAVTGDVVTRLTMSWLSGKRDRAKPFFLYVFYFDPHYDYVPPPPYDQMFTDPNYHGDQHGRGIQTLRTDSSALSAEDRKNIVALYDGEIRYTDEQIGKLLEQLKAEGLLDDTIVVLTGDHGEEFWEHGNIGHGRTLYDEVVRVPLIIRYPALVGKPMVIQEQVSLTDLMPTLLNAAHFAIPGQCQGKSLLPLLNGDNRDSGERSLFLETDAWDPHLKAVRTAGRKIVETMGTGKLAMYSLAADPLEKRDLADTVQQRDFKALSKVLRDWEKDMAAYVKKKPWTVPKVDARLMQQLRSLGYVH